MAVRVKFWLTDESIRYCTFEIPGAHDWNKESLVYRIKTIMQKRSWLTLEDEYGRESEVRTGVIWQYQIMEEEDGNATENSTSAAR